MIYESLADIYNNLLAQTKFIGRYMVKGKCEPVEEKNNCELYIVLYLICKPLLRIAA